jgi:toxin ParE1/3/4
MSDRFDVRITREASSDLEEISDYISAESPQNAVAMVTEIVTAIFSLATLPHRFKVHQPSKKADRVVRAMLVYPYIVYYRIADTSKSVQILTVRHGARRQPKRFN